MNSSYPSKIVRHNFSDEPSLIESVHGEKSLIPVDRNRQQPINSKIKVQITEKILVHNTQRNQNSFTGSEVRPSELLQQSEQSVMGNKYKFYKRRKDSKSNNEQSDGFSYQQSNNNLQRQKEKHRQRELRNLDNMQLVDWNQQNAQNEIEIIQHIPTSSVIKSNKTITKSQICLNSTNIFDRLQNNTRLQCSLRRNKKAQSGKLQYEIQLQGNNQHVLTIRKEGIWQYVFYLREPNQEGSYSYRKLAKLKSSFFSDQFTLMKEGEKYSNCTICYESNFLGLSGPRKMHIYLPKAPVPFEYLDECYGDLQYREKIEKCINKQPIWSKKENSYVLSFRGRAPVSSIKNFVITDKDGSQDKYHLVFGKAGDQIYNLDVESPFSLIQGVAVAVSSFEHKITCD